MFSQKTLPVWVGVILLSSMFLMGQQSWEPPDYGTPPALSNLWQSRYSAYIGEGGGAIQITGGFDFIDSDGDLDFVRASERRCGTGEWHSLDSDIAGVDGLTSGFVQVPIIINTFACPPGTYYAYYSVYDKQGNVSNALQGSFTLHY